MKRKMNAKLFLIFLCILACVLGGCDRTKEETVEISAENKIAAAEPETVQEDLMLTYAPDITLTDTLSSVMNSVKLQAGNCSWNYMDGTDMTGIVACGAHPLDEAFLKNTEGWDLPEYQGTDELLVTWSCKVPPDKLVIREWDLEAAGNYEAEELSVTVYDAPVELLKIKTNRIYELTGVWNQDSGRGYYGEGSYILVTK